MQELIKKMIIKAMAAHHADVDPVKKPGQKFVINDTNACVDAIKAMKPIGGTRAKRSLPCTRTSRPPRHASAGTAHQQPGWTSGTAHDGGRKRSEIRRKNYANRKRRKTGTAYR
jgi:hypothetical protein